MSSPFLDTRGGYIPIEQVWGNGNTAVVLLQDGVAVKVPLRYPWHSDSDVESNIASIRHEQDVYRRLQNPRDHRSSGIVRCIKFSSESTELAHMTNGDLRTYLETHRPPYQLQLRWFRDMARTLNYIHDRSVLVADIASRNFLVDSDLSLKICDFSEASILPLDCDMEHADDNGYTTRIDVGLLGAVIYEIVTGQRCSIDLYKDNSPTDARAYWPKRKELPDTNGIEFGDIIESCWDGRFQNSYSLLQGLESINSYSPYSILPSDLTRCLILVKDSIVERPITSVIGALSLTIFTFIIAKKRYYGRA